MAFESEDHAKAYWKENLGLMLKLLACMVVIFAALVGGCIIIGVITYGFCTLMEYLT